jgi:F-type H+-transporting ATPase subunit epsilon
MASLALSVVTPNGVVYKQQVDEVTVPGLVGEFGVLPGHIAMISALRGGVLSYRTSSGERGRLAIGAGFAEVDGKDTIAVLVKRAARADKVDRAEAEQLLGEASGKLGKAGSLSAAERELAEEDRAWAQAQLDALRS